MQMHPPSWPHTTYCSPRESFCRVRDRVAPPFSRIRRGISPAAEVSRNPEAWGHLCDSSADLCPKKADDDPPPPGRVAMQQCRDHKPSLQGSLSWSSDIKASPGIENAFLEMVWGFHYFKSYFEINLDFQKNCIRTILVLLHLIPSVNLRPHLLFFMFIICLLSIHAHAFLI